MKTYHEYTNLSQKIHAPEELKAKVLQSAAESGRSRKKASAGCSSRGWGFVMKAAVAALLAVTIPVAAYAAAKSMGLTDWLTASGMQDVQNVEKLTNSGLEGSSYRNGYAEYSILEAVCDSQTIYLAAQVKPIDSSYFLVPQYIMEEDSVSNLGIDGLTEGTVGEYAASLGKSLVYAGVGYYNGENHLDGSEDFRYGNDGTLYYYYSAQNISGSRDITLKCSGYAYTTGMSVADRAEFEVTLFDKSSATETLYTNMEPAAASETGIQVNKLKIAETEIGLYAAFTFVKDNANFEDITFALLDAAGQELRYMPGIAGSGMVDNGDGTCSVTMYYQKPDSMDGLQFAIRDSGNDVNYGPYSFSK